MNPRARRWRITLATIWAAAVLLALIALGTVEAVDQTVKVIDFAFQPSSVTVTAGDVVTWQNTGGAQHTITADNGSFDSGPISTGEQFAHLFDTAGTVAYHCSIHLAMTGMVIVKAAPVTAVPTGPPSPTPPPGTLPPGFTRHPDASSAEPSSAPAGSPIVASTVFAAAASSAPPTATPSAPTSSDGGSPGVVLLVVVLLVLLAGSAWLLYRRRLR